MRSREHLVERLRGRRSGDGPRALVEDVARGLAARVERRLDVGEPHQHAPDDARRGLEALRLQVRGVVGQLVIVRVLAIGDGEERGNPPLVERPVIGVFLDAKGVQNRQVGRRQEGEHPLPERGIAVATAELDGGLALPGHVHVQHGDDVLRLEHGIGRHRPRAGKSLLLAREPREDDGALGCPAVVRERLAEHQQRGRARRVVVGPIEHASGRVGAEMIEVRADDDGLVAQVRVLAEEAADHVARLDARVVLRVDGEFDLRAGRERLRRRAVLERLLERVHGLGRKVGAARRRRSPRGPLQQRIRERLRDPDRRQVRADVLVLDRALDGRLALADQEGRGPAIGGERRLGADGLLGEELRLPGGGRSADCEHDLALHVDARVVVEPAVLGRDAIAHEDDLGFDGAAAGVEEVDVVRAVLRGLLGPDDLKRDRGGGQRRPEREGIRVGAVGVHRRDAHVPEFADHPVLGTSAARHARATALHPVRGEFLRELERTCAGQPLQRVVAVRADAGRPGTNGEKDRQDRDSSHGGSGTTSLLAGRAAPWE